MSFFSSRVKLEFYVDCIGQFLSMIIWLGWQASLVALVGQVGSLNTIHYAAIESNRELNKSLKVIALLLLIFGSNMKFLFLSGVKL